MISPIFNIHPPALPGVYIFKTNSNEILYIGKAKNLAKRIFSYNTNKQIDWKISYLIKKSDKIDWIITESEKHALELEAELISSYKPLFNKLLLSDTPFNYIIFYQPKNKALPTITISRSKKNHDAFHIGPFLRKKEALDIYNYIIESFQLLQCNKKIENGCLNFHLGKCAGTCKTSFSIKKYKKNFQTALESIKNPEKIIQDIDKEITALKKKLDIDGIEILNQQKQAIEILTTKLNNNIEDNINREQYDNHIKNILININIRSEENKLALKEIKSMFAIDQDNDTITIDCIDVSHFQGSFTTGACIRYTNGIYNTHHSQAHFLSHNVNNDYMNLALTIQKHYIDNGIEFPDILLIDGGIGQLQTIKKQFPAIKNCIALAKREEILFISQTQTIHLDIHSPIGKLLINIRNNTHHAALSLHQKLRNKSLLENKS
jgi:excinuclease UvrABC nuclease subunit